MSVDIINDSTFCANHVEHIVLECTEDNHYKYYHLSRDDKKKGYVLAHWGRIGSKHQSKEYKSSDLLDRITPRKSDEDGFAMWLQMVRKLRKGYKLKTYKLFGDSSSAFIEFANWLGNEGVDLFDDDDEILI